MRLMLQPPPCSHSCSLSPPLSHLQSPTQGQLRATEALLAELITTVSSQKGSAVNTAVFTELQRYLQEGESVKVGWK